MRSMGPSRNSLLAPEIWTIGLHSLKNVDTIIYSDEASIPVWANVFHMERKQFKKRGYSFHFMIHTDGVSCTVLLALGANGSNVTDRPVAKIDQCVDKVTNVPEGKIIGIDVGKDDLVFASDGSKSFFRYSYIQRRKEMKAKRYAEIRQECLDADENAIVIRALEKELSKRPRILVNSVSI